MATATKTPSYAQATFGLHPARLTDGVLLIPVPWRIRAQADGETIIDTREAWIAFAPGSPMTQWLVPVDAIAPGVLDTVATTAETDDLGSYRCADLVRTDKRHERAVRIYDEINTAEQATAPAGKLALVEMDAVDTWLEEEQVVVGHPRSPFHRVDAHPVSATVTAAFAGQTIAESSNPVMLVETLLPERWYLPWSDVRHDLLIPSDTRTYCGYKGEAHYFHIEVDGKRAEDAIWYYPWPFEGMSILKDRLCVWPERVDELKVQR